MTTIRMVTRSQLLVFVSQVTAAWWTIRMVHSTYTPNAGFDGTDDFAYTLSDGTGGRDTANVIVTILPEPITENFAISETTSRWQRHCQRFTSDEEQRRHLRDDPRTAFRAESLPTASITSNTAGTFNVPASQAVRFSVEAHHDAKSRWG